MQRGATMKKFVVGVIVGALLAFSPQVYSAAVDMVGKKVDGELEVKLNGKSIGKAAVIEGKSLLPVRAIVDGMGLDVKVEKKEVIITSNDKSNEIADEVKKQIDEIKAKEEIENLKKERTKVNEELTADKAKVENSAANIAKAKEKYDDIVARTNDQQYIEPYKLGYESAKKGRETILKRIEDNEKELERINNKLKELGAE